MNEYALNVETIKDRAKFKNNYPQTMRARGILKALERAGFKCENCDRTDRLTTNHLVEDAYGWHPDEIQILCSECHTSINRGVMTIKLIKENRELKKEIESLRGVKCKKKTSHS